MKKRKSNLSKARRLQAEKGANKLGSAGIKGPPKTQIDALLHLYTTREFDEAESLAATVTTKYPADPFAWKVLAAIYGQTARLTESVKAGRKLVALSPNDAEAHNNLGSALRRLGSLPEALESFKKAVAYDPAFGLAHFNAGTVLMDLEQLDAAGTSLQLATSLSPNFADGCTNYGLVLKALGRLDEAEVHQRRALALRPNEPEVLSNLSTTLHAAGKFGEAESLLLRAISLDENSAGLQVNLGSVLLSQRKTQEAVDRFELAVSLDARLVRAHANLGVALYRLERLEEAAASCRLALEVDPNDAETHNNLGVILHELGRPYEAMKSFAQAVEMKTDVAMAEAHLVHQRQRVCEFLAPDLQIHAANHLGITGNPIRPFLALSWADNPEQHLLRARAYCNEEYKAAPQSLPVKPAVPPPRLKIGYFSADFHDFPGMYLMAGLLESHDRERFEVYAFSYGPDRDDAMRRRIVAAVDHFIDIREMSTQEAVDLSRKHGIDIALHRNGHTKGSRTELFQHRLAPVQVSYLGYPGTLGADFIDYLVADPVVIPEKERQHYCEKIIYLPDTYQPNDNTRHIAETSTTRADFNLPEDAFVFCCFNHNYKISPREFDIWMRLLGNVEGSVLWLLNSNVWAVMNLKKEAERRGIDPSRLIFAEKIPHAEHLARHKHADLFVDTFNYNAHTTASDALWTGLPVVTKQGRQFAARVAASLLTAVGLPELITESEEDYERLILNLAQDRQQLSAIKATLEENRRTEPLFDTQRYTRYLETGLIQAYQHYFCGSDCMDIWIRD